MPKISALPPLSGQPADDDLYPIVDTSTGVTKKSSKSDSVPPTLRATRYYTSGATWSKPAGMSSNGFVIVEVIGGGGGSGGCATTTAGQSSAGGGGGGGGYSRKTILNASLASTVAVGIGAGGTAASAGANNGGTGGTSSFGTHATATGGTGGTGGTASGANSGAGGGAGGTGASGDTNIAGQTGYSSRIVGGNIVFFGVGGTSARGFGQGGSPLGAASAAQPGNVYGGGACAGNNAASTTQIAGAAGAAGTVIVQEWY